MQNGNCIYSTCWSAPKAMDWKYTTSHSGSIRLYEILNISIGNFVKNILVDEIRWLGTKINSWFVIWSVDLWRSYVYWKCVGTDDSFDINELSPQTMGQSVTIDRFQLLPRKKLWNSNKIRANIKHSSRKNKYSSLSE